jgi:RNA polymerase sigma factor (TIGR02999 family)
MEGNQAGDVTGLLVDWNNGDQQALERLTPLIYDELHGLAAHYLRRERRDHTLQATALVHEAFVRLIDQRRVQWRNTVHFKALAAQMMRRVLVDHARSHRYQKRGGGARKLSLDELGEISAGRQQPDVVEVHEALDELTAMDPELGRIVELRFFGGLTSDEIAEAVGVSIPTVTRRWRMARAWLYRHLGGEGEGGSNGGGADVD